MASRKIGKQILIKIGLFVIQIRLCKNHGKLDLRLAKTMTAKNIPNMID